MDIRTHHWHVMLGPSGLAAWWPRFRTVSDAAWAAAWYAERTGQLTYVKTCKGPCVN